jgi:hypothetical protein
VTSEAEGTVLDERREAEWEAEARRERGEGSRAGPALGGPVYKKIWKPVLTVTKPAESSIRITPAPPLSSLSV